MHQHASFNSLQTGKCIQRVVLMGMDCDEAQKFQFPSNGKVYPKRNSKIFQLRTNQVSIPFKRESVSKVNTLEVKQILW